MTPPSRASVAGDVDDWALKHRLHVTVCSGMTNFSHLYPFTVWLKCLGVARA